MPKLTGIVLIALMAGSAAAVKPKQWTQKTEADFAKAELDGTVVTNYGRIELSRATETRSQLPEEQTVIHDIVPVGKALYLAAGPKGWLLKADADGRNVKPVQQYEGRQVFALASGKRGLWVAISGEKKTQLELRGSNDAVVKTIDLPDVRYIWDLLVVGKTAYLATGTDGKVLAVALDKNKPKPRVLLDCEQDNVLCLGIDGQGRLYAGTDGEGLVYRLTPPRKGKGDWSNYVLYDANEPEIGALLVEPDGTVYAGTADADQAKPGRKIPPQDQEKGKPEAEKATGQPAADQSGKPGKPGEKSNAGQPAQAPSPDHAKPAPSDQTKPDQPAGPAASAAPVAPTAEQYDRLRAEIKKRLTEAKEAGTLSIKSTGVSGKPRISHAGKQSHSAASDDTGNAVYRIDPAGFVREVFRESVMILHLVRQNDRLLIATGNEGQLYQVELADEQTSVLADLEPKQIPAMIGLPDGTLMLGTANAAALVHVNGRFAGSGTFTSDVLDASQISLWGKLQVLADVKADTAVTIETRSGNVGDPKAGSWSAWSPAQPVHPEHFGDIAYIEVASPPARFFQYRLTLRGNGRASASVDKVSMKYLMPNLKPKITEITTEYDKPDRDDKKHTPQPTTKMKIEWKAKDPNEDKLAYTLELRKAGENGPWYTLAEKLTDTHYEWNTRTAEDGRYLVRLTASDEPDNMPDQTRIARRISAVVTVDNTSPHLRDVKVGPGPGDGQVSVQASIRDDLSDIAEVRYSVNGGEDWQAVLPTDQIYDSTSETVSFIIPDLSPGAAVITVRALDSQNNAAYATRAVTVPGRK